MACRKVQSLVWMMVVAMAAIMVAENGKLCFATFDMGGAKDSVMNTAEKAKESSESWASWAYAKISGYFFFWVQILVVIILLFTWHGN